MQDARNKLRRTQLLERWPTDFPKPSPATLFRLLDDVVSRGLVRRDGTGHHGHPYRYWLPANEERIATNWLNQIEENAQEQLRKLEVDFIPNPEGVRRG